MIAKAEVTEVASFKLQGSVLLLEGRGVASTPEGREVVVHDALAIISFDRTRNTFVFSSNNKRGGRQMSDSSSLSLLPSVH